MNGVAMYLIISITALAAVVAWVMDARRLKAINCITKAEELRLQFGRIRHKAVMHASSGLMDEDEVKAFKFVYEGTTFMLHHPGRYNVFSDMFCVVMLRPRPRAQPPAITKRDLSKVTRPLVKEYLAACDEMVDAFADPVLTVLATLSGESVVDMVRNASKRIRQLEAEKQDVRAWRDAGRNALQQHQAAA